MSEVEKASLGFEWVAGAQATFRVLRKDDFKNIINIMDPDSNATQTKFQVEISGPGKVATEIVEVGDGSFEVRMTGRVAGKYSVAVMSRRQHVQGSPFVHYLVAARATAGTCRTQVVGIGGGRGAALQCRAGDMVVIEVEPLDQFSNPSPWHVDQMVGVDVGMQADQSYLPPQFEHQQAEGRTWTGGASDLKARNVDRFVGKITKAGSYLIWLRLNTQVSRPFPSGARRWVGCRSQVGRLQVAGG
jgi:hypothetical protein